VSRRFPPFRSAYSSTSAAELRYPTSRHGGRPCLLLWIGTHEWLTAGVVRPSKSPFFPLARVGPTTPTRASARARKEPTGSAPKAGSRQTAKDDVGKPCVRFLARSKRGTRFRTASLLGGRKLRTRRFCTPSVGRDEARRRCWWRSPDDRELAEFPIGITDGGSCPRLAGTEKTYLAPTSRSPLQYASEPVDSRGQIASRHSGILGRPSRRCDEVSMVVLKPRGALSCTLISRMELERLSTTTRGG
jgi:hypothetical protein